MVCDGLRVYVGEDRQLLDVIKDELDRRGERVVNSVQALLLFNIGDQELTAGELRTRGHYLGSNVCYNLKKLVESGYIHHERSEVDLRSVLVRLTRKGEAVRDMLRELFDRHLGSLEFSKLLLAEAKVCVSPGIGFGEYGDGYVRFALIENEARTRQALRGIKDMFKKDGLL